MRSKIVLIGGLAAAALLATACGAGTPYASVPSPSPSTSPSAAPVAASPTASNCNSAACVQAWPPVLTKGSPQAGSGVNAALLGTTTRRDGKTEVTYAGHPLYYFISDKKAGDVTGQGINAFGGPWYVVSASGTKIV